MNKKDDGKVHYDGTGADLLIEARQMIRRLEEANALKDQTIASLTKQRNKAIDEAAKVLNRDQPTPTGGHSKWKDAD